MKLKALVATMFFMVTLSSHAQINKQATARIFESPSKELSRIVLVYETGESQIIPLRNWRQLAGSTSFTNEVRVDNQKTINQLLNDMGEKGYRVLEMSNSIDTNFIHTFIIFTKEE